MTDHERDDEPLWVQSNLAKLSDYTARRLQDREKEISIREASTAMSYTQESRALLDQSGSTDFENYLSGVVAEALSVQSNLSAISSALFEKHREGDENFQLGDDSDEDTGWQVKAVGSIDLDSIQAMAARRVAKGVILRVEYSAKQTLATLDREDTTTCDQQPNEQSSSMSANVCYCCVDIWSDRKVRLVEGYDDDDMDIIDDGCVDAEGAADDEDVSIAQGPSL